MRAFEVFLYRVSARAVIKVKAMSANDAMRIAKNKVVLGEVLLTEAELTKELPQRLMAVTFPRKRK